MTPREADRIIKKGQPVWVRSYLNDVFEAVFVRRDRRNIYTADGGTFSRDDLQILPTEPDECEHPYSTLTYVCTDCGYDGQGEEGIEECEECGSTMITRIAYCQVCGTDYQYD